MFSTVCSSRWRCRSSSSCDEWRDRTTVSSAMCPASPECTTSTTTPMRSSCPGWSSTATTRLFFVNAEDFKQRALNALDIAEGDVEWFLLNAEAIVEIDITAIDALDGHRRELERRGIVFALARVKQ